MASPHKNGRSRKNGKSLMVPTAYDWRSTDADELTRRRLRAQEENFRVTNLNPRHPIFSNFRVQSASGMKYSVEIRSVRDRQFTCTCVDFRINGLGTCKHVESVLMLVETRHRRAFQEAQQSPYSRVEIVPDEARDRLRVLLPENTDMPSELEEWFTPDGAQRRYTPEEVLDALHAEGIPDAARVSQDVVPWLEARRREIERKRLRREYELKVQSNEWPAQETLVPLFPYQREGMLHLAFTERALLADEMGLGKTIQAIAACALLHRLGKTERVLVVTPASLKTEWEDQIQRFTPLPYRLVFGPRHQRLAAYDNPVFFTIVNYEQMMADALEVNQRFRPDVVVLDEAQRIKNWSAKTTQAIKRLSSRYAFVLTGTPIENRIDELYSLMDFLNPRVLGPLFRFNREYYELDDRGRPKGFRNLRQLHDRIAPYMLRRRKADVETELPSRTDRTHFVPLSEEQQGSYDHHQDIVARLASVAERRPLTLQEQEKMQRELAMMRMVCDTNYILDPNDRVCPKLKELEKIIEECRENSEVKVIIFSEWERMLELVRELCERMRIGFAWHTGSVPQRRRRAEINAFKNSPDVRIFLSTDSGATGLNLQNASVVINCDLPWNPAKLEQRIARAWRKNQTRPVTVINLVSEKTIEHRMLDTLKNKQSLADGVLDLRGDLSQIKFGSGRQTFIARLQQLVTVTPTNRLEPASRVLPADRALAFAKAAQQQLNGALVRCEERFPQQGAHSVLCVVVENNPAQWQERLSSLHAEFFGGDTDPLAPTQLEVIDRTTDAALQRLQAAGLIASSTRATRPLLPASDGAERPPLTAEDQEKAAAFRNQASRKLKMARVLASSDLGDESRTALMDAALQLGRALALENRLPEPARIEDALLPSFSFCWKEALPTVRQLGDNAALECTTVADALGKL
jgi:hypothetical protein